jgi:hypothetical protein
MANSKELKTEPCGTPAVISKVFEVVSPIFTEKPDLLEK